MPERFRAFVDAVEQDRLSQSIPGLAVAIVEGGELSFAIGLGSKDPEHEDPVLPTTLFRIASCTKPLTAVSLLQRVQRDGLQLDATLTDVVPTFQLSNTPDPVPSITLRQLLSHSSGLGDYLEVDVPAEEKRDRALEGFFLGRYRDLGFVMGEPGSIFSYSNAGFSLLGLVDERAGGDGYRKLVRDQVLSPLRMDRTYFLPSEVLADGDYALGTCPEWEPECGGFSIGPVIAPDDYDNAWARPAAAAWSSVLDLAKFARFLVHGNSRVLSDRLRERIASPQISTRYAADELSYGLGLELSTGFYLEDGDAYSYYATPAIFHEGLMPGFRSVVECVPSLDLCVIGLANHNEVSFSNVVQAALRLVPLPAPSAEPELDPTPERFAEYAGTYFAPFANGEFRVTLDGAGNLQLEFPLADAFRIPYVPQLVPTVVDNFIVELDGSLEGLTFLAGASGRYDYLRIFDRQVAVRIEDE